MSENFYKDIKAFSDFDEVFNIDHYVLAPSDWFVIVTDIKNSTTAVESGKYKDVNLIGSACIGAISQIGDYPFVFGGDGASFLIPPSKIEIVKEELVKIQNSARSRFKLSLRVGIIPVETILKEKPLRISKYKLTEGKFIAKFSGGGLELADKLIKSDSSYLLESEKEDEASFDGVSCRWNPIKNSEGLILTLVIKADDFSLYNNIKSKIDTVLGTDINRINPVKVDKMTYMDLTSIFFNEKNYENKYFSISSLKRVFEIFFAFIFFKPLRFLRPSILSEYEKSMVRHSDFRKFDDTLRMVVDCGHAQKDLIIDILNSTSGITFGYSCSDHALMTCLVFGLNEGEHIHFIDGANGGYTEAAKMMKLKAF